MRRMRVLTRYTVSSVLKVGILTALLASLMMMGVDLFSKLDTYTGYMVPFGQALWITVLYLPESLMLTLGPAMLFSVTYFMSMLHANNEIMCILGSGISRFRTILPIVFTGLVLSVASFFFNEYVAIDATNLRDAEYNSIYNSYSESGDNVDLLLSDMHEGYVVMASSYSDYERALYDVELIVDGEAGPTVYSAQKAEWDSDSSVWNLLVVSRSDACGTEWMSSCTVDVFTMDPDLFRNHSSDVTRMRAATAIPYLERIKVVNIEEYASLATQFWKRIFSCLTPFAMMLIACCMKYRFRKNTMFFSLLVSLCLAVVYYVIQMMTVMLAEQGMVDPILGNLMPLMAVVLVNLVLSLVVGRS